MQPDLMLLADIGDLVERIERSDGSRAGAGNHRNDGMAIIPKTCQSLIELSDIHAAAIIEADLDDVASSQPQDSRRSGNAVVRI